MSSAEDDRIDLIMYEFTPATMWPYGPVGFFGETGTGKTRLMASFARAVNYKEGHAFYGSIGSQKDFLNFLPAECVEEGTEENVERWMRKREDRVRKGEIPDGPDVPEAVVFIDDMGKDSKFMRSKTMTELFSNGRHLRAHFYVSFQFRTQAPPAFRDNLRYGVWTRDENITSMETLFKDYGAIFLRKLTVPKKIAMAIFQAIFAAVQENDYVIVLDKRRRIATEIHHRWYFYKVDDPHGTKFPDWKIGDKAFLDKYAKIAAEKKRIAMLPSSRIGPFSSSSAPSGNKFQWTPSAPVSAQGKGKPILVPVPPPSNSATGTKAPVASSVSTPHRPASVLQKRTPLPIHPHLTGSRIAPHHTPVTASDLKTTPFRKSPLSPRPAPKHESLRPVERSHGYLKQSRPPPPSSSAYSGGEKGRSRLGPPRFVPRESPSNRFVSEYLDKKPLLSSARPPIRSRDPSTF